MKSTWITKKIFKKALEEKRVYLTTKIRTSNGITGYNIYIYRENQMYWLCGHSSYWSDSKECYHCTAWGTSRPLEIILSIGYELGLTFHEIRQNHQMI